MTDEALSTIPVGSNSSALELQSLVSELLSTFKVFKHAEKTVSFQPTWSSIH